MIITIPPRKGYSDSIYNHLTEKIPEQTGVDVVSEEQQQGLCVLEGIRELCHHLVERIEELQEHRRALVRQMVEVLCMSAAVWKNKQITNKLQSK